MIVPTTNMLVFHVPSVLATLVMLVNLTGLPASSALLKDSAPYVSMATIGTVFPHSIDSIPRATPAKSPPPPTHVTTAPGLLYPARDNWPCI